MWVVYLVTTITLVLFFPLKINLLLYFDEKGKRLFIWALLYGCIKLYSGRFEKQGEKIIYGFSKNKSKIVNVTDIGTMGFKPVNLKGMEVVSSRLLAFFPTEENFLVFGYTASFITNYIGEYFSRNKDFLDLKSTVVFGKEEAVKVYYQMDFILNFFTLSANFFRGTLFNEK